MSNNAEYCHVDHLKVLRTPVDYYENVTFSSINDSIKKPKRNTYIPCVRQDTDNYDGGLNGRPHLCDNCWRNERVCKSLFRSFVGAELLVNHFESLVISASQSSVQKVELKCGLFG